MKKSFVASLLLASAVAFAQQPEAGKKVGGAAGTAAQQSKAHVLSNRELDQLLAQPDKVLLIDVRRPDEVTSIGGFPVYLSIQQAELEKSLQWIPKERAIVTVSNHAGRAGKAAELLAAKGFKVAGAVGAETYEKAGGKIAHIAAKPAAGAATGADK